MPQTLKGWLKLIGSAVLAAILGAIAKNQVD
jgi:hypothetical protein